MATRWVRVLAGVLVLGLGGCAGGSGGGTGGGEPAGVAFTKVELPAGAAPVALATAGDTLLIGARRDGQPLVPGLLRRTGDGSVTEIQVHEATPYGRLARWYSISSDGERVVAVGGARGGAHSNVRWSAWTGQVSGGITEKAQAFSTFGGYGAGELIDAVLTPAGPVLIGSWQSAQAGLDIAAWTLDGETWTRQSSAGTALESTRDSLGFPVAATAAGQGVAIAGWRLAGGEQPPVVWRSASGATGWTATPLPGAGKSNAALAIRCPDTTSCAVAGRVDGTLAIWRRSGDRWERLPGVPPVPVGDKDKLVAPIDIDGQLTQLVADAGRLKILRPDKVDSQKWTVHTASGPTGPVTALTTVGDTAYLLAGPDEDHQTLWRAEAASLR